MVSKTDDIPASVPNCNPVDVVDEAGDGAHVSIESSKTGVLDFGGCDQPACLILLMLTFTRLSALHIYKHTTQLFSYNVHPYENVFKLIHPFCVCGS